MGANQPDLAEASGLLAPLGLGPARTLGRCPGGYANLNLKIDLADRSLLLRIGRAQTREEIRAGQEIVRQIAAHGFPTPVPLRAPGGEFLFPSPWGPYYVLPFLPGAPPEPTPANLATVGRTLALLHRIPPPPGLRPSPVGPTRQRELLQRAAGPDAYARGLLDTLERLLAAYPAGLPRAITHNDLYPDNLLFAGEALVAVLDFEDVGLETRLLDLGTTAAGCCFDERQRFLPARLADLLRGYEAMQPLGTAERAALPVALCHGVLLNRIWHYGRFVLGEGASCPTPRMREMELRELSLREDRLAQGVGP